MTSSKRSGAALLGAAMLLAPAAAGAATFGVSATGWTSLDGGTTKTPFENAVPEPSALALASLALLALAARSTRR